MFPRWLSWLFVAFLVYIVVQGHTVRDAQHEVDATSNAHSTTPTLSKLADTEHWKQSLNPDYVGATRWREIKPGSGTQAQCGDTLTVAIAGSDVHTKPLKVRLGTAPIEVLNTALLGMKPGSVREIELPAASLDSKKKPKGMKQITVERIDTP